MFFVAKMIDIKFNKKKKGIFFTFLAIAIMAILALVFSPPSYVSLARDNQALSMRVNSIDNYVDELKDQYFETVLRAATYKALLSLVYYMNATNTYLTDVNAPFSEVIIGCTINGVPIDTIRAPTDTIIDKKIMCNSTLTNWSNRIIQASQDTLNVKTIINISNVRISQTQPWFVDSQMDLNFTVKSDVATWEKNVTIKTTVSIEGLPDPYYLLNTRDSVKGSHNNNINRSIIEFDQWDTSKVREALKNGNYMHFENSEAPSFLMRFTNTIAASNCCGIESFVNPNILDSSDQKESYVDYLFWVHAFNARCSELYNINGLWNEFNFFKLDVTHLLTYKILPADSTKVACV